MTHIRLLVVNYEACFRFYRDVMRFEAQWGDEGSGYSNFKVGEGTDLALFGRQHMAETVGRAGVPVEVESQDRAMLVFEVDDLEVDVKELRDRGVEFETEIESHPEWGMRAAYLRDPAGTLIELYSPLMREEWTEELREQARQYE
jgi:catechol 2,3-dioxygenase-like lactoylglutathione lyase family enzyme